MTQTTSLAALKAPAAPEAVRVGFETIAGFEALQRMALMFTRSSIVPRSFSGEGNVGNAVIAMDMALRMHANPLMVMQNLYVVHGSPAWSAKFMIATLNQSGRFSALRYVFQGQEGTDTWGCRACATELATGERLEGPLVTIGLARKEGWFNKPGSKWHTMPEQMLRYRAAAWFVNVYAPEIAMGLRTAEEEQDAVDYVRQADGSFAPAAEEPTPTITTAQIAAQVEQHQHVESVGAAQDDQPAEAPLTQPQEAAPAPAPAPMEQDAQAAADKEAEKRRKEAELEALRAETEAFCLSAGMDTRAQEWAVGGKTRARWTATDCKRLRKTAEERLAARAAAAEQPQATQQEEDAVRTVPCPRTGERVAETVCNACGQRNGCPEWEA